MAAWVYLKSNDCETNPSARCKFDAVSVDGDKTSKFRLGHVIDDDQNMLGAWTFEMPESDDANAPITKAAVSTSSATSTSGSTWSGCTTRRRRRSGSTSTATGSATAR